MSEIVGHECEGACACARWALEHYWHSDDRRPWVAVETAEQWCRGEATIAECRQAVAVAAAAAADADADAAADAADAAAATAYATVASAANAAATDAAASASVAALRELCNVVRAAVQCPPTEVWLREEERS